MKYLIFMKVQRISLIFFILHIFFYNHLFGDSLVLVNEGNNKDYKLSFERIHSSLNKFVKRGIFGKILIAAGNKVIIDQKFGNQEKIQKVKNQFLIASVTKIFTAVAILRLLEQGKIDLLKPIAAYLPANNPIWGGKPPLWIHQVTPHQLLTHSSGTPDYISQKGFEEFYSHIQTTQSLIEFFSFLPLQFPAGSKFEYSGSGYLVLGALIEALSHKPYEIFLSDEFFTPLKMKQTLAIRNTFLFDLFKEYPNISQGYHLEKGRIIKANNVNLSTAFAEACIISSTEDLFKWSYNLFHGRILSQGALKKMLTPYFKVSNQQEFIGYGIFIKHPLTKGEIDYHDGRISGYQSYILYIPQRDLIIIILSNLMNWEPDELINEILK